ncbi:MAG: FAD-dependent monooxygenase [Flammeovirgaceae bacterium]|nr:FAD-dependent monooxygenase [Flammeovirgaceae bacterium]MDW8287591.1 FAD-dependent monooxygenase [Flammeovirgaceae bacterium]
MTESVKKGIIIGAGIGGLTTALALLKKGIEVTIYEQASEIREVGAGIWIAPNAMKVLHKLGISDDITKAGKLLKEIHIVDLKGKPISVIEGNKVQRKHGFLTVAIHRSKLQQILISHLPPNKIVLNKKFSMYQQEDNSVTAIFDDGSTVKANFLILADGIKSKGRFQMYPSLNLRYSGQTCWRFITEFELPKTEENNMYEIWSDKKGLRVEYSKISDKQVYAFITNYEKEGGKDDTSNIKNDLLTLCSDFPEVVKELIFLQPLKTS